MSEVCLFSFFGQAAGCIQDYIIYGILLFVIGLLIAVFVPLPFAKKLGFIMTALGLVLAVAFPLVINLWQNSVVFQMIVYGSLALIVIMVILFPDTKIPFTK